MTDTLADQPLELKPSDFRRISALAHEKFGLNLPQGKEGLVAARLGKKIRQGHFASFADYYRHVVEDRTGSALIDLIDALTTNHTFFLRERAHFDFLGQIAAGWLRKNSQLRIWSAACSTGEEPYSIAMYLTDVSQQAECRWSSNFHILATDISTRVLEKARRAVYGAERFQEIPEHWWKSYLLHGRGECRATYKVKPAVANLVEFNRLNLIEPLPYRNFEIIFCRNVLMYFDKPTQQNIVARLADRLEPGGYLFVGHSETLTGIEHRLSYVRPAVYRNQNVPGARGKTRMNSVVVGISDCKVSGDPDGILLTYALGSCIAIAMHDPVAGVGGLLHYMLPESALDKLKASENPYMFADTGIQALLKEVCGHGASRSRLIVRIAGGAQIVDGHELFQIGRRNYLAARKLLWKAGILVAAEAVGGEVSRTVRLEVKTGRTWVREGGLEKSLSERQASGRGN